MPYHMYFPVPQVCILWNLQHGCAVVPKCSSEDHAAELLAAASLSAAPLPEERMAAIDAITSLGGVTRPKRFIAPPFMMSPGPRGASYGW